MLFLVICFVLCWTPYYCIVFFLIITDTRIDNDHPVPAVDDLASLKPSGPDERPLLIFMMLAVSNSVLDPLIYGNSPGDLGKAMTSLPSPLSVSQVVSWFNPSNLDAADNCELEVKQQHSDEMAIHQAATRNRS